MISTESWMLRANAAVVDASALVDLLTNGPAANAVRERLAAPDLTFYAPDFIDVEVLNVLRRGLLSRKFSLPAAEAAIDWYPRLPIFRLAVSPFFRRIWSLRDNITAYDAAYVAVAEAYRLPLITLDARLAKAAPPTIRVELFA